MTLLLNVQPSSQTMYVLEDGNPIKTYHISTAKNGLGNSKNSYMTPTGLHMIRAKIGQSVPLGAVFKARRWTKEIFSQDIFNRNPGRDWILSRIMWLSGLEIGKNRLGSVDTMARYVYIHGVPDSTMDNRPASKGCIGMYNKDIIELFDMVSYGTKVYIGEDLKEIL